MILVVVKAMKNPRSALCKTSIMVASDIFNAFGEKLLDSAAFDQLVGTRLSSLFEVLKNGVNFVVGFSFTVIAVVTESFSGQEVCV